jgi:hypothetical protein
MRDLAIGVREVVDVHAAALRQRRDAVQGGVKQPRVLERVAAAGVAQRRGEDVPGPQAFRGVEEVLAPDLPPGIRVLHHQLEQQGPPERELDVVLGDPQQRPARTRELLHLVRDEREPGDRHRVEEQLERSEVVIEHRGREPEVTRDTARAQIAEPARDDGIAHAGDTVRANEPPGPVAPFL